MREKIDEQRGQVENSLETENKAREEIEEAIVEMLKEMVSKIKIEIDAERRERQLNHDTLLTLLDDTCNKFNNGKVNHS